MTGWHQVRVTRGIFTVVLHGQCDLVEADEIERTLCPLAGNANVILRVDMSDVTLLDTAGLRVILAARAAAEASGASFTIVDPSPACVQVFELAGVATVLDVESQVSPDASLTRPGAR